MPALVAVTDHPINRRHLTSFPGTGGKYPYRPPYDTLPAEEFEDSLIHGLHTLATPRLDQRGDLMCFAFPNQIGQGCRPDQNLDRDHPPMAISPHQELLGDNAFERLSQHDAGLALLFWRKDINEAVHCRGGGP